MELGNTAQWVGVIVATIASAVALTKYSRSIRLRKRDMHIKLELASINLFMSEIEHPELMKIYGTKDDEAPARLQRFSSSSVESQKILEYAASLLNLFEIHLGLLRSREIEPEVFATWIPWIAGVCRSEYFRWTWRSTLKIQYLPPLQELVDLFIKDMPDVYSLASYDSQKKNEFCDKASNILRNNEIMRDFFDAAKDFYANEAEGKQAGKETKTA